jgi:hypothetical protein
MIITASYTQSERLSCSLREHCEGEAKAISEESCSSLLVSMNLSKLFSFRMNSLFSARQKASSDDK